MTAQISFPFLGAFLSSRRAIKVINRELKLKPLFSVQDTVSITLHNDKNERIEARDHFFYLFGGLAV